MLTAQCFAYDMFMGFDVNTQKMYAVVRDNTELHVYVTLEQTNSGGWIGDYDGQGSDITEFVCEASLSPDDPDRLTDIPEGQQNVIVAHVDFYDQNYEYLGSDERTDTLLSNADGDLMWYTYVQEDCQWDVPDTIRINTAYCATICHGSRSIPIFCEDPGYNPALLEVTVTNGCHPDETECDNPTCEPVDWSLFTWRKRVFPNCNLFLEMVYCGDGPGCVCIWRSDFYLPVEMSSFDAVAGDRSVTVNWATMSESELSRFRISRSTTRDGGYTFIGSVDAANSATGHNYSFVDENVINGQTYYYKLHIQDADGALHVYNNGEQIVIAEATPNAGSVNEYSLAQNFPNPFNSQTTFSFALAATDHVSLKVFDLLGREVATVVNRTMDAGVHNVNWTAEGLATGVYIYTLTSNGYSDTKKLLFLK
jgi:hypothetical protein